MGSAIKITMILLLLGLVACRTAPEKRDSPAPPASGVQGAVQPPPKNWNASQTLQKLGEHLEKMSPEEYVDTRISAARQAGGETPGGIPEEARKQMADGFRVKLTDKDPMRRLEAAMYLGYAPASVDVVQALISTLSDENRDVRDAAAEALIQLGTTDAREALIRYEKRRRAAKKD
jgi:hypothetical protein